jgi:beta-mannosidase
LLNQGANFIRMWGGGIVEKDSFYTHCDEKGILIWHDMFIHSNTYPDYDEAWLENFRSECENVIRNVRVHPCLCAVCGGNEIIEGWNEYGWQQSLPYFIGERLFKSDIPPIAKSLCPDLPYIENSPHGGKWANSPVEGDCHNWGNFFNSTKDPIFVTETCWTQESYSRPQTLKKYMALDVKDFSSGAWGKKWKEITNLDLFCRMHYSSWYEVETLERYLHSLEIEQMRADYFALNQYRFHSPGNSGVVYWSMNKGGPLFQFGCVDYGGYPLMSYYTVKRIFAPIAVEAYRDVADIAVMLSNQEANDENLIIETYRICADGKILNQWETACNIKAGELKRIFRFENLYTKVNDRRREAVYVCVYNNDDTNTKKIIADDLLFFCPFSEFELQEAKLDIQTKKISDTTWSITVSTDKPVRFLELEASHKAMFTDDYFPLIPAHPKTVTLTLLEKADTPPSCLVTNSVFHYNIPL